MEQSALILNLTVEGLRPSKIALAQGIPIAEVTQEIARAIKERRIKRRQVLAVLEDKWKEQIAIWLPAWNRTPKRVSVEYVHEWLKKTNLSDFDVGIEELGLYLLCSEKSLKDGELYEIICEIERTLHAKIESVLGEKHGPRPSGWWRKGVPKGVRQTCVEEWEEEPDFVEYPPYHRTTLGELQVIIQSGEDPELFKSRLPLGANGKDPNMHTMFKELVQLTKMRNKVMHRIGAAPPTEEEFFFVREMQSKLDLVKWR
jgi:hypothetical protein